MRLLKILVIIIFIASLANANICQRTGIPDFSHDSGTGQLLISGLGNPLSPVFFDRQNQTCKKTTNPAGLSKPILTSSSKLKLLNIYYFTPFYYTCESSYFSLISLHCLLTV